MVRQCRVLLWIWTSDAWQYIWNALELQIDRFDRLGLPFDSPDSLIWRTCQRERLVLITGNWNESGPDSLGATIRDENRLESLPVITVANAERLLLDREYAERVAVRILGYLIDIDEFRGAGRLYAP